MTSELYLLLPLHKMRQVSRAADFSLTFQLGSVILHSLIRHVVFPISRYLCAHRGRLTNTEPSCRNHRLILFSTVPHHSHSARACSGWASQTKIFYHDAHCTPKFSVAPWHHEPYFLLGYNRKIKAIPVYFRFELIVLFIMATLANHNNLFILDIVLLD